MSYSLSIDNTVKSSDVVTFCKLTSLERKILFGKEVVDDKPRTLLKTEERSIFKPEKGVRKTNFVTKTDVVPEIANVNGEKEPDKENSKFDAVCRKF